jgi:hypothetical protein
VKCGKGGVNFHHPANELLRLRVAIKLDEHCAQPTPQRKTLVIGSIIEKFNAEGARFLRFHRGADRWYDGGLKAANDRIGTAFRNASQPMKVKCMDS